jgi:hypothetical protein
LELNYFCLGQINREDQSREAHHPNLLAASLRLPPFGVGAEVLLSAGHLPTPWTTQSRSGPRRRNRAARYRSLARSSPIKNDTKTPLRPGTPPGFTPGQRKDPPENAPGPNARALADRTAPIARRPLTASRLGQGQYRHLPPPWINKRERGGGWGTQKAQEISLPFPLRPFLSFPLTTRVIHPSIRVLARLPSFLSLSLSLSLSRPPPARRIAF